jgi:hypothetical protein
MGGFLDTEGRSRQFWHSRICNDLSGSGRLKQLRHSGIFGTNRKDDGAASEQLAQFGGDIELAEISITLRETDR